MPNNILQNLSNNSGPLSVSGSMFSPEKIFLSTILSIIGLFLLKSGWRKRHVPHILIGFTLTTFSYFTPSTGWDVGLMFGLCMSAYLLR